MFIYTLSLAQYSRYHRLLIFVYKIVHAGIGISDNYFCLHVYVSSYVVCIVDKS